MPGQPKFLQKNETKDKESKTDTVGREGETGGKAEKDGKQNDADDEVFNKLATRQPTHKTYFLVNSFFLCLCL